MTGHGVTVVVVDDGVEHTIKDIQPNYVSACTGWRAGGVTGACESSESDLCRHLGLSQGGKCQQQTFPGRFCTRVSGLPAFVLPVGGSLPQTLSSAWSCLGWSLPHGSR